MSFSGVFWSVPIFLLTALGAYNRVARDEYLPPEYGKGFGARLEAYIEPVRLTQSLIGEKRDEPSDENVLKVANAWSAAIESGALSELPSVHISDTVQTGVKAQILLARNDTVSALTYLYDRRVKAKDYVGASEACRLILNMTRVLRHSDLPAITQSVTIQNAALRRLNLLTQVHPAIRDQRWVQDLQVTPAHEIEQVLRHNFRIVLADDGLKEEDRKHLEPLFKETVIALQGRTRLTTHCPWKETKSFAIALLHANYARVTQQIESQSKLVQEVQNATPSRTVAHLTPGT